MRACIGGGGGAEEAESLPEPLVIRLGHPKEVGHHEHGEGLGVGGDELAVAVGDVQRFVAGSRDKTAEQVQRLALVDHVFSRHEHFDADQLMEQLPNSGQPGHVSRPTVYRTLSELVDAGLLRSMTLGGRTVQSGANCVARTARDLASYAIWAIGDVRAERGAVSSWRWSPGRGPRR